MAKAKKKDSTVVTIGGKSRGKRKLTNDQVVAIASAYKGRGGGVTMKALAEQYGVSIGTISAIKSGRTYTWLTGISAAPVAKAA